MPPWELAEKPSYWMHVALMAQNAENLGEGDRMKAKQGLSK